MSTQCGFIYPLNLKLHSWGPFKAGKDATEAFFSLHRYEVLARPQYKRLQIGSIAGQVQQIHPRPVGGLSKVPYAEATWLTQGYFSPYFKDVRTLVISRAALFNLFFSTMLNSNAPTGNSSRKSLYLMAKLARRTERGLLKAFLTRWRN